MCQCREVIGHAAAKVVPSRADERRATIRRAAVQEFLTHGHAATSMAKIAASAGVSRPALYQYFSDKDDVFASAFASVFEVRTSEALAALRSAGTVPDALDALLQRYEGDLWKLVARSKHFDEIVAAKSSRVTAAVAIEVDRFWGEVARWLATIYPGGSLIQVRRRDDWLSVLRWAPQGLRVDRPSVSDYRRRLATLARGVAADVESVG
ncbi:MAG: helix-turn-helix domain containing protein [Acidimicrobiales bacterium]|nr:helix-turn-helix domain containing protein [Acidimicrobiales bacterium]MDG1876102.1 helix-turn-helix domain containing protein [Acidimicrobiales bacterium]